MRHMDSLEARVLPLILKSYCDLVRHGPAQALHVGQLLDSMGLNYTLLHTLTSGAPCVPCEQGVMQHTSAMARPYSKSFLPCVVLLLPGIPISLSIVYMEVARRVGLSMLGVNLPAHFMIRPQVRSAAP